MVISLYLTENFDISNFISPNILIDAQHSAFTMARGTGPPEDMVKKLKDEHIRRQTLKQFRARNFLVASSVLGVMGAIYIYTLKATKQSFLDKEFDKAQSKH